MDSISLKHKGLLVALKSLYFNDLFRAFSLPLRAVLTGGPKVSWFGAGRGCGGLFRRCGPSLHHRHYRLAFGLPGSTGGLGGALSSPPTLALIGGHWPSKRNLIRTPIRSRAYFAQALDSLNHWLCLQNLLHQIAKLATMSNAVLASQAVFRSRATEIGVETAAIQQAIDENIGTLGQFGFSTSFIPGHL